MPIEDRAPLVQGKTSWAKECVTGALLSAAFTIMASNAGGSEAGLSKSIHDFIIMGGIAMGVICGVTAVALLAAQAVEDMMRQPQAIRFVKIFLP